MSDQYEPRHLHDPWAWLRDLQRQGRCTRVEWHESQDTVPDPMDPAVLYFVQKEPSYQPAHAAEATA
jgi:hypothetical protein